MKTEFTDFDAATAALHAEMAKGTQTVTISSYQRKNDFKWVWVVQSDQTPCTVLPSV